MNELNFDFSGSFDDAPHGDDASGAGGNDDAEDGEGEDEMDPDEGALIGLNELCCVLRCAVMCCAVLCCALRTLN